MADNIEQVATLEDLDIILDKNDITFSSQERVYYRIHKGAGRSNYHLFLDGNTDIPFTRLENLLAVLVSKQDTGIPEENEEFQVTYVRPRDPEACRAFYDMLVQTQALAIDVHTRDIYVTWRNKDEEKAFQQAWRERPVEPIDLYETEDGHLFLHQPGASLVYQVISSPGNYSFFEDDCRDIAQGNTHDWNPDLVHGYAEMQDSLHHPQTLHIATWFPNKPYVLLHQSESAGMRYLKLTD